MSDVMHHVSCVTVVPGVAGPNFGGPKDARPNGVEYFDPRLGTYIYIFRSREDVNAQGRQWGELGGVVMSSMMQSIYLKARVGSELGGSL